LSPHDTLQTFFYLTALIVDDLDVQYLACCLLSVFIQYLHPNAFSDETGLGGRKVVPMKNAAREIPSGFLGELFDLVDTS